MKNNWNNIEAKKYIKEYAKKNINEDLALRIYTTHLLGKNKKLVLHGGGNTSVKSESKDIFQNNQQIIYVKGSGWDMSNLNELGLPGLYLKPLIQTQKLKSLSDNKMVNFLRLNLINSISPNPSVETLLHAYIPHKFVDHTHSNAILSIVNQKNNKNLCKKIFRNKIGIVPYVMPGFELAKLSKKIFESNPKVEGLILLNHGIFTFGNTAKQSYNRMIKYVTLAEKYISNSSKKTIRKNNVNKSININLIISLIRKKIYKLNKNKWIINYNNEKSIQKFFSRSGLNSLLTKGPITPDHVIRIKPKPLFLNLYNISNLSKLEFNLNKSIDNYVLNYKKYFNSNKYLVTNSTITDPIPRIIVIPSYGYLSLGRNYKETMISKDIFNSMIESIQDANKIGVFKSISEKEIFKMEYWPLERAKLYNQTRNILSGNIVVVTGGAGTIGSAIAKKFLSAEANVVILDNDLSLRNKLFKEIYDKCLTIECDLTNEKSIKSAIDQIIKKYGGIDILISNAGRAYQGKIYDVNEDIIRKSFEINFYSHQKITQQVIEIMKLQDYGGNISFNLSKQSINPGNNFGPYGLPKSSTLFLMKQYALECGKFNIKVNGINADKIEGGMLTSKLINERAKARNLSKQKYMKGNLLKQTVLPEDVAEAFFNQILLKKTTGNIITVDGGNMEASLR